MSGLNLKIKAKDIAKIVDGEVIGNGDHVIFDIKESDSAGERDLTFWDGKRPISNGVGVVISRVRPNIRFAAWIKVENYRLALAKLLKYFEPQHPRFPKGFPVFVDKNASVSDTANIGPFSYISEGAIIKDKVVIYPFVFVGRNAVIGKGSIIFPFVYIGDNVEIGDGCIIYPGAVIGSEGFGFERGREGWIRIPQIGNVVVGKNVRLGANTCVDRATFGSTEVGDGTKVDNLVQIAHNVKIGPNTVIASQSGIAGGTLLGKWCVLAGQVGIVDNVQIGDGVVITAGSGVDTDIPRETVVSGKIPARKRSEFLRSAALFYRLPEIYKRLKDLEKELGNG